MPLDETFTNLAAFLNSLDAEGEQKFELSHSLVIICPDCGKNIAFRGRCPKCAGNSWIPAGHSGGIFERTKAQRLRRMIADDDVTLRGGPSEVVGDAPQLAEPTPAPPAADPVVNADEGQNAAPVEGDPADPDPAAGGSRRKRRKHR
ncbi:MAG TPA: hypothetical protein VGF28_18555 [Thermoanaerobaculia bacterium]|jgi:hypothetical protein